MKTKLLFLILCCFGTTAKAQVGPIDSNSCFPLAHLDSTFTFCDSSSMVGLQLVIEPTVNNLWQNGHTTKFGTSAARDTACAMVTDTAQMYAPSNQSAFSVQLPLMPFSSGWRYNYYFKFWHRFDTDSLRDGCWLEFSNDSGVTWFSVDTSISWPNHFQNGWSSCNFYNNKMGDNQQDTLLNGHKAWSGNSQGWRYTALWLNMAFPVKPERSGEINAVRFVFASDTIDTQKAGWIIDDIQTGWVETQGAVSHLTKSNALPVYPNPSANGEFTMSYPSHSQQGPLEIYSLQGQLLQRKPLTPQLNLSTYPNGVYFYKVVIDEQVFSGTLVKQP
ncbi:MAG TPA: T9SS type A sorting domain-containing protein [Chitinophagaceae bacterium]|nr:T9SS type A sorting domain-containing protein [Chitinophagaceae bacterium]